MTGLGDILKVSYDSACLSPFSVAIQLGASRPGKSGIPYEYQIGRGHGPD